MGQASKSPPIVRFPWLDGLLRDLQGGAATEFALVAPALFLMLYTTMELANITWTQSALNFAVEEAARCASVTPSTCGTSAQIATYAAGEIPNGYVPATDFSETTSTCGHQVTVSFPVSLFASNLTKMNINPTLSATACYP